MLIHNKQIMHHFFQILLNGSYIMIEYYWSRIFKFLDAYYILFDDYYEYYNMKIIVKFSTIIVQKLTDLMILLVLQNNSMENFTKLF